MTIFKKAIMSVAGNQTLTYLFSKYGLKLGAARFVGGKNIKEALDTVQALQKVNILTTLDYLGESVTNIQKAKDATHVCLDILNTQKNNSHTLSVKLTQLGLDIDLQLCMENIDKIIQRAKENNTFVQIDMEDSSKVDDTLRIFNQLLHTYGNEHVGAVIQSYLYRSENDMMSLGKIKANIRIVKGAYNEPRDIAFHRKKDVDTNFISLVKMHLNNGCYTAIATHNEYILNSLKKWILQNKIPPSLYEFQLLYGIRFDLQKKLAQEGYTVRSYVPFGEDWYSYFIRRIAERPANALFVLRNTLKK